MGSVWHTPRALQSLMDKFPLKTYPADNTTDSYEDKLISKRQYKFRPLNDTNYRGATPDSSFSSSFIGSDVNAPHSRSSYTNSLFQLGIYNVVPLSYDEDVLASLDPLCLCSMLIIAYKGGFKLPLIKGNAGKGASRGGRSRGEVEGFCSLLSYQSSTDGELPILIEDEDNKKQKMYKRKIRSATIINQFNMSNITDLKEAMMIELLDTVIYDFLTTVILFELDDVEKAKLFLLNDGGESFGFVESVTLKRSLASLVRRYNFHLRNPELAYKFRDVVYGSIIPDYLQGKSRSVEPHKSQVIQEGFRKLLDLEEIVSSAMSPSSFTVYSTANGDISLFDIKLASYMYCIMNIKGCPSFKEIILSCPQLAKHCELVIRNVL